MVLIYNDLDVCGNVIIDGTLTVSGDTIFNDLSAENITVTIFRCEWCNCL